MSRLIQRIYHAEVPPVENKDVSSLWMGDDLSSLEQLSIKSYLYHGHNFVLYIYDNIGNIPYGVDVRDANEILGIDSLEHYHLYQQAEDIFESSGYRAVERDVYIPYSNLFRYNLLYRIGGWWSDLDMVCLKPYDFESPYVFCRAGSGPSWVCGSVVKSPRDSFFLKKCIDETLELCKELEYVDKTGPSLLDNLVSFFKLEMFVVPHKTFFPVWFRHPEKFLESIELPEESYGVHVCSTKFSQKYDKDGSYDSSCLFEKLKRKYL